MHYYSHNIGDYRRDTSHLSLLEHGIYRQMMDTYYLTEKPLPLDHAILMRTHCARTTDEVRAVEHVLNDFFVHTEDGYIHKRCDVEIEAFHSKSVSARESAKARWDRVRAEKEAEAMRTHCEGNANHKPLTINQELEDQKPLSPDKPEDEKAADQKKPRTEIPFDWILKKYNEICGHSFKGAATLTDARKKNITKCWARKVGSKLIFQSGDFWKEYFNWSLRDPHWHGEAGKTWKASLEFLTRHDIVDRIIDEMTLEGVFANEPA